MTNLLTRRRILQALISAPALMVLSGCGGDSNNASVLPDQGKINLPQKRSDELKPKKGMDRNGS